MQRVNGSIINGPPYTGQSQISLETNNGAKYRVSNGKNKREKKRDGEEEGKGPLYYLHTQQHRQWIQGFGKAKYPWN